jgi:pyruvate/2-oxoglutarate dehydrogenase complex dihydrolipoamide dehydrogenase (E3) component
MPGVKHELVDLLEYYRAELRESQVEQVTGKRVTPDLVREWAPDSLIVAIGAKPVPPELPGIEGEQVVDASRAVLQSSQYRGARIAVIGGSTIGCEVALLLRRLGNSVTVLERSARLMEENPIEYNTLVLERFLREEGVEVRTAARVLEIRPAALLLDGSFELPVDVAVYVPEYRPRQEETDRLLESCRDARALGDCVKPAGIFQAVTEGFSAGKEI